MPYDIAESHPHVLMIRYRKRRLRFMELMAGVKEQAHLGHDGSAMLMRRQAGDVLQEAFTIKMELISRGFGLPTKA